MIRRLVIPAYWRKINGGFNCYDGINIELLRTHSSLAGGASYTTRGSFGGIRN